MKIHSYMPDWLAPLTAMLWAGKCPANDWVVLSLVGALANWVPWIDARSYRRGDDLSALTSLVVEVAIDDATRYGLLLDLTKAALAASPRLLGVSIGGASPTVVVLKKPEVLRHGA